MRYAKDGQMAPSYRIETDAGRQLIRLTFFGHWDSSTIAAYQRDLERALANMAREGGTPGSYLMLIDLREQAVQPQEIAGEFEAIIASYGPLAKRSAILMSGSILHKMQVARISADFARQYFCDREEALDWLLRPSPAAI